MPRKNFLQKLTCDFSANRRYPKSCVVLFGLRLTQECRRQTSPIGRIGHLLVGSAYKFLSEWILGIELPASTTVGPGLRLRHGVGLVVNPKTRIGKNVMIRHGVTLGNRTSLNDCPVLEDDVEVGAGAVIIGSIVVGRGARIAPNAVVFKDVPADSVVYSPLSTQQVTDES